ncbi:GtrA family protein [Gammaproteobacteria bacterium]|nr:GtrA family protein [Gammaproteobacteria bacterium]
MNIFFRYVLFCIVATLVNLITQRIFLELFFIGYYFIALIFGTLTGLITKYILDKNYIFKDFDHTIKNNSKKFSLYTFNGIFTTVIFWGTESLFFFVYGTTLAREFGAVIGLSIGYFFKYKLDKRYVF